MAFKLSTKNHAKFVTFLRFLFLPCEVISEKLAAKDS